MHYFYNFLQLLWHVPEQLSVDVIWRGECGRWLTMQKWMSHHYCNSGRISDSRKAGRIIMQVVMCCLAPYWAAYTYRPPFGGMYIYMRRDYKRGSGSIGAKKSAIRRRRSTAWRTHRVKGWEAQKHTSHTEMLKCCRISVLHWNLLHQNCYPRNARCSGVPRSGLGLCTVQSVQAHSAPSLPILRSARLRSCLPRMEPSSVQTRS